MSGNCQTEERAFSAVTPSHQPAVPRPSPSRGPVCMQRRTWLSQPATRSYRHTLGALSQDCEAVVANIHSPSHLRQNPWVVAGTWLS